MREQDRRREERDRSRPERAPDNKANRTILIRTLVLMSLFGVIVFLPLLRQLWSIQITHHEEYQQKAINQQTMDSAVAPDRGKIVSADGEVMAMSATVYNVILSPHDFKSLQENWDKKFLDDNGNPKTSRKDYYPRPEAAQIAQGLAAILGLDAAKVEERIGKTISYYEVLSQRVERETADQVSQYILDNHLSNSVYCSPTSKRYYPKGSLAAQVIGWVNPNVDNTGAYGMEALYEDQLAGKTGRVVTAKDGKNRELKYSFQDYYDATDGNDVNITINTTIQYYCERILEKGIETFEVQDGGFVIAMDPKTGAIKAWANSPDYDLNDPWTVSDPVLSEYLTSVEEDPAAAEDAYNTALTQMLNRQWRNKAMNDSYEPGSTFKTMVLAAALEEGVVSESDHFYCPGYYVVGDTQISCSQKAPGHKDQDLATAVANSCNPAFMMIGQRLGAEKFYQYVKDFGLLEKTGVDMQGEGKSLFWDKSLFTAPSTQQNTYLATASFGQRFQVTPIQLITAASAVINGGHLMQPYVMESITDPEGNVVKKTEPTEVRQVISEETSERCRKILEGVVDGGTGKRAYVPGYRIGGKTGSSETVKEQTDDPIINKGKDYTIVSFLGFAPADDPQIVVLLAYNAPKPVVPGSNVTSQDYYISGGNMAASMAGELLENILDYMGVERQYTEEEKAAIDMTVPNLVGQTAQVGVEAAKNAGFTVRTVGEGDKVTAQIPVGGAMIPNGSQIVLYLDAEKPDEQVKVPSLRGKSLEQAREALAKLDLYLKVGGSDRYLSSGATVATQSVAAGTMVEPGTVIDCTFSDNSMVRT